MIRIGLVGIGFMGMIHYPSQKHIVFSPVFLLS
jgi:hypothetical protein